MGRCENYCGPPVILISKDGFFTAVVQIVTLLSTFTWGVQVLRYPNFFLGNGSR